MTKKVILISGYAQTGKTTAALYLKQKYDLSVINFADPIYNMLEAMYEISVDYIMKNKKELMPGSDKTWRQGLQTLGTEWGRELVNQHIWSYIAQEIIQDYPDEDFVIADLRFLSELEYTRKALPNYKVVHLHIECESSEPQTHHKSEQEIEHLSKLSNYQIENHKNDIFFKALDKFMEYVNE